MASKASLFAAAKAKADAKNSPAKKAAKKAAKRAKKPGKRAAANAAKRARKTTAMVYNMGTAGRQALGNAQQAKAAARIRKRREDPKAS